MTTTVSTIAIKQLRNAKAWSQQHLADAAGLSLRTVQRVEADGTASAETRLALAAALGVCVDTIAVLEQTTADDRPATRRSGQVVVFAASGVGALFVLALGRRLPDTVASHFGVTGQANAFMGRDAFVSFMCLMVTVLPSVVYGCTERSIRRQTIRIPHAAYWLSPPERPSTEADLLRYTAVLCVVLTVLGCVVHWMTVSANLPAHQPPKLDTTLMLVVLGSFIAFVAAWLAMLDRRFGRLPG